MSATHPRKKLVLLAAGLSFIILCINISWNKWVPDLGETPAGKTSEETASDIKFLEYEEIPDPVRRELAPNWKDGKKAFLDSLLAKGWKREQIKLIVITAPADGSMSAPYNLDQIHRDNFGPGPYSWDHAPYTSEYEVYNAGKRVPYIDDKYFEWPDHPIIQLRTREIGKKLTLLVAICNAQPGGTP